MHLRKQAGLALGAAAISLVLVGGAAQAAFQPAASQAPHDERKGPPLARFEQLLGSLVTAGKLTAEQRDAILAGLRELAAKRPATTKPVKPEPKERPAATPKPAKPEPKERAEKDERKAEQRLRIDVHTLLRDSTKSALAYIGIDLRALQVELRAGKSLADVAVAQGKSRDGLIAAIMAPASTRLAELVASGKVTGEQATKITDQVAAAAAKIADAKTVSRSGTAPGNAKKR